jgi:hypothetical protein
MGNIFEIITTQLTIATKRIFYFRNYTSWKGNEMAAKMRPSIVSTQQDFFSSITKTQHHMQTFTKTTKKSIRGFYRFMGTLIVFMMAFTFTVQAQIPVTVTGETNTTPALATSYTSLSLALTALNGTTAMTGPVTFTLNAGASETAPATGFVIGSATLNPVLSATNTVTIVKASGSATTINAGTGTATPTSANPDGMLKIVGADYITIDGLTFNDGNVTNPQTMEFGIGLFKLNAGDGAQNNTIQNCIINMQRINNASSTAPMVEGSVGIIMMNASNGAATTNLTITAASGTNSNNKFYSNSINGGNYGMALIGFAGATPFTTCDQGTIVGASGLGNTILNFGGGAATNPSAGIRTLAQYGISVGYNTINNNNGSGVNHATTFRGIYLNTAVSASATITNNTVSIQSGATTSACTAIDNQSGGTAASNTINITNNTVNIGYPTATTGVYTAINNGATAATVNINGNTVTQLSGVNLAGTGTHVIIETGSPTTANANNNIVQNITRNGASGSWRGIKTTSPTTYNANNNTVENISWSALTSTGSFDAIYSFSSAVTVNANNNIIRNLSTPTTGTIRGIAEFGSSGAKTFQNNQIYNFFTTAGGAGGASFTGISESTGTTNTISGNQIYDLNSTGTTGGTGGSILGITVSSGTTNNIYQNKIYGLSSTSTNPLVSGITISGGTTSNLYNNLVGNLTAPAANAANPINGFNLTGGTTVNAYYNTIYINASSSGALFGSSAITFSSSTPALNLRNSILVNTSSFNSTGLTAALRRSGGTTGVIPSNYAATSNNNIFYAGTPGASNLLYVEGTTTITNPQSSLAGLKSFMVSRDQASFTENPPFLSTTGSSSDFLHINTAIPTLAEGKAVTISGFTDDFDGNTRNVSTPDIGADEFTGTPVIVVAINSVSASPTGNLCIAAGRTITANVTVGGTAVSSVVLNYSFNGVAQTPITMTGGDPNIGQTSNWTASLPVASPTNASVTWSVTATDAITNVTLGGTSYADEPLTGVTGTASASISPVCQGSASVLTGVFSKTGTATVGAGGSTSSSTAASFFPGGWGGAKTQYIVLASELTAAGLAAGPITSLGFDVTVVGQTYQGFTVQLAHTTQIAMTTTFIGSGFTQVYKGTLTDDGYLPTVGVNTLAFGTGAGSSSSFTWDGTSNLVVSICWSRVPAASTSTSSTMKVDAPGFTCSAYEQSDLATPATMCAKTLADGVGTSRPQFRFGGQVAPTFTTYTWNDGTSNIGTGNPFTVNPTSTTTYTVTATDANGCTVTSSSVTVTTNALPAAPSGAPSSQCGTGVPTCFVAGTSNGNYRWYLTSTGGTALPGEVNDVLGSYSISTTTTFYVSIFDGTCESLRTPVVASVNAPDAVSATSNGPVCANTALQLTATVTSNSNGNVYNYTWSASPSAGSGIPTTQAGGTGTFGSPITTNVTPTAGGTYVYTVNAVDGTLGCTTTATVTVNINNLPQINTPTATPSTVCQGAPVVLTASTNVVGRERQPLVQLQHLRVRFLSLQHSVTGGLLTACKPCLLRLNCRLQEFLQKYHFNGI